MCETKNLYLWLLQVVALLGILAICLWLILRPRPPQYTIVDFSIPQSSLVNKEGQNGTILYNLEIENPNTDSTIYYDDIFLTFYFGQDTVGEKRIPAFHQGGKRTRQMIDYVDGNPRVWKSLLNALISNSKAELKAGLLTRIRYKTWGKKSKHHKLELQGLLQVGKDGKISGKKKNKLHPTSKKWRR